MRNKSKKQLYETIMKLISKIVKRHLNENIFDDFYEEDDVEKSTLMDDYIKISKLVDCTSGDEVRDYIIDKINLHDICNHIIRTCLTYKTINNLSDGVFINDLLYARKEPFSYEFTILFEILLNALQNNLSSIKICCKADDNIFNIKYRDPYPINYDNLFKQIIERLNEIFLFDRIAEELTCTPKIYKVTQKDIDRMDKCIRTNEYLGFDKITKSDKMVARLAALLIVGEKKYGWQPLKLNDETLLRLFTKNNESLHSSTTYRKSYPGRYHRKLDINVFRVFDRIKLFPDIHIADVLATYDKYKNLF